MPKSIKKPLRATNILILSLIALGLIALVLSLQPKPTPKNTEIVGRREIQEISVGQEVKIAGYRIKFTNPRYEFDEDMLMNSFKVDVFSENQAFPAVMKLAANCDLADSGEIFKSGVGVEIRAEDDHLHPGEKMNWTLVVPLEIDYANKSQTFVDDRDLPGGHVSPFPNRRVSNCSFTPTGLYDPNISVEVKFK